jgi:hypothetical protein
MMLIQKAGLHSWNGAKAAAMIGDGVRFNGVICAGGTVVTSLAWTVAGLFYVAELGVNYRRLQ